jgi:integrase
LSVAYGAGLRVAEVAALKVSDINSERMLLRIERGKGGRYRNAMLPEGLLLLLREWWRAGRQQGAGALISLLIENLSRRIYSELQACGCCSSKSSVLEF